MIPQTNAALAMPEPNAPTVDPTGGGEAAAVTPAIIVLGKDEGGRHHASWFDQSERSLASKAAAIMGMRILSVAGDRLPGLAAQLPQGRVFASGRAFVPFVKESLYVELAAHLPKRQSDEAPVLDDGTNSEQVNVAEADGTTEPMKPIDWGDIAPGALVLASEGPQEGWYEAIIIETRDEGQFLLRWQDWPEEPELVRHREQLGLLHPNFQGF